MLEALFRAMPWFVPALLAGGVLVGVAAAIVARKAGRRVLQYVPFAVAAVLITAATLPPSGSSMTNRSCGGVEVARLLAPWAHPELLLNFALFLPLGAAAAVPALWRRLLPLALGVSPAIEAIQWTFPLLGRSCQGDDLVANTLGVIAGAACAYAAVVLVRATARPHPNASRRPV